MLVANRGEIACRIIRTLRDLGLDSVAVYSDADRHAPHVRLADRAVRLGPAPAAESYLSIEAILAACRETGATAVHPGYGFLSEAPELCERLEAEGIAFVGPTAAQLRTFGLKHTARAAAEASGVPLLPGSGLLAELAEAEAAAAAIGYPVMLKSTAGGGGIGLQLCRTPEELPGLFEKVRRLAAASFGDAGLYLEKFVAEARHVEVQIFGDGEGHVIALGERDCSLQRRNQKVVEETPAPGLSGEQRRALSEAAVALGRSVSYRSAGTVEFILDAASGAFWFLEVNTRLQVEHPVTEAVTGLDLVAWMVRLAAGELPRAEIVAPEPRGAAIEVRLYAEDPGRDFRPSSGRLTEVAFPEGVRVDGWIETGSEISTHYDPLLAKLIVRAPSRSEAIRRLSAALAGTRLYGIETNLDYLRQAVDAAFFREGRVSTRALAGFDFRPATVEVLSGGTATSVQDWPGRVGYWHVGVPPSGPMDALSHRLANRLVGNAADAPALELTLQGPTLRFAADALVALTGAGFEARLDDEALPAWQAVPVRAGQVLEIGRVRGPGLRGCLAVRHGFDVPRYLGSASTFDLGRFGGHATGLVRTGDVLRLNREGAVAGPAALPAAARPEIGTEWEIGALYGPHGAPDFFREADVETLFATRYEVHFNSARTGVRLIGPKPEWAREDGGEAGLHPSNIHDNAYAIGALDFTGDMPILLGPDGPSLGGFVCPLVVAKAELWKLGQLKPGDGVRFRRLSLAQAEALEEAQERLVASLAAPALPAILRGPAEPEDAVVARDEEREVPVCYRRTGEDFLLVEFGPMELSLDLRVRAHELQQRLEREALEAVIEVTPGIRSLQVHFDNRRLSATRMLEILRALEAELPPLDDVVVPSRIVHLPLSWDDESTRLATRRYQETVRPDAPWCPWNIEFIRRVNGLDSVDEVKRVVFEADYLVYGLGDVYLGAPVASPLDPRHRLVTTKYNPARPWTPENAVGIGGAYLCVYGMEGPGGYQFVGRTVQVWNTWRRTAPFAEGRPWLLRFFDRIRFHPVEPAELLELREAFPYGGWAPEIEAGRFELKAHHRFLAEHEGEIAAFTAKRNAAFAEERRRWAEQGIAAVVSDEGGPAAAAPALEIPEGARAVESPMAGVVWKLDTAAGRSIARGEAVAVLEAMKTETEVSSPCAGTVLELLCKPGQVVRAGDPLMLIRPAN
ncbi:urea carboxylase [Tistlia consotensis]|uniref:urea carboxylase n=1 Tax=Tistlia consotensis TaxID=1321365 RepID=UPI003F5846DE